MENTFRDELGPLADHFFGVALTYLEPLNRFSQHSRVILQRLMEDRDSPWFDDVSTPQAENFTDILEKSIKETAVFLKQKLGEDPSAWRWRRVRKITIEHPLGRTKPLDRVLNISPFEGGGHFCTVSQSAVSRGMDFDLKA